MSRRSALTFDFGERRIGVAFANRQTNTATALKTIDTAGGDSAESAIRHLIEEWQPEVLVIGVPYNLDGSDSPMTLRALDFGKAVGEQYRLPVESIDERLTSAEARMILRDQRQSGARRRKIRREDIDSLAARLIAESWLREE